MVYQNGANEAQSKYVKSQVTSSKHFKPTVIRKTSRIYHGAGGTKFQMSNVEKDRIHLTKFLMSWRKLGDEAVEPKD